MGNRDTRVADDLTNNQNARLQKEREHGRHAYYKNGRLHTEDRQQNRNRNEFGRGRRHVHRDSGSLYERSFKRNSRDARGDKRSELQQGRHDQDNGPHHKDDWIYSEHSHAREFGRARSPICEHYRDYSPPSREDRHYTFPGRSDRDYPPPRLSVSASYYSHQQRNDRYYSSHNDRNDRDRREDKNRWEYQHQSRTTGNVGHTFDSWDRMERRDGRQKDDGIHTSRNRNGPIHDREDSPRSPPPPHDTRSRSPRDKSYAEVLKNNDEETAREKQSGPRSTGDRGYF